MKGTLRQIKQPSDVSELLYGDGAWEIAKALTDRQKRVGTAALSAVGGTAGALGLAYAGRNLGKTGVKAYKASQATGRLRKIGGAVKTAAQHDKFGAALLPAEVLGLGGEIAATKILHGDTKKKTPVAKSTEFDVRCEISKMDPDKRQVFGWASIVEVNGEPVIDLQGDYMTMETIEKAAYDYVKSSRKGGNQHERTAEGPRHVSDMIESLIVTEDKKKALGLPPETPTGWWVGFQVNDDDTWNEFKTGKKTQFSIHGSGVRKDVEI